MTRALAAPNLSYIHTQIGAIRTELNALKTKLDDSHKRYGYNAGFYLADESQNNLLQINGRIQGRYIFNLLSDNQNVHTFSWRRAMLLFSGNALSKKATYVFVLNPIESESLVEFDVGYAFLPELELHMIQASIPLAGEGGEDTATMSFATPSIMARRFDVGGTIGLTLTGSMGNFSYYTGVYNGLAGGFASNSNSELAYGLRVDWQVFGDMGVGMGDWEFHDQAALSVGLGGVFGHYEDDTQARLISGAIDAKFKTHGFTLFAGGVIRQIDPDQFSRAQIDIGATAYVTYFVIPKKLELAARFSILFDDIQSVGNNLVMGVADETGFAVPYQGGDAGEDSADEWEATAAVSYYFYDHNSKLQLQYIYMNDGQSTGPALVAHMGFLQFQLGF